jgi:anti-repressor protein
MNELIPFKRDVMNGEYIQTVNDRDFHVEVESKFPDWMNNRIKDGAFFEGQDFMSFSKNLDKPNGGRPAKKYQLSLDMAKHLS